MKGIKFNDVHSYNDLNLVLAPFQMPPATPKGNYIDVPGADGSLDLTEALGEVKFNDRQGGFLFSVLPEDDFEEKKTEVNNLLNGLKCRITVEKDPDYYYIGRLSVSDHKANKKLRQITVDFRVQPYKYKNDVTVVTSSAGSIVLANNRMSVVPKITTTAETTLIFKGNEYVLNVGTHEILDIQLLQGDNPITIETDGTVTFEYQEGAL